jgi:hypothetical protein
MPCAHGKSTLRPGISNLRGEDEAVISFLPSGLARLRACQTDGRGMTTKTFFWGAPSLLFLHRFEFRQQIDYDAFVHIINFCMFPIPYIQAVLLI